MKIAADFAKREVVHSANLPWVSSPMAGVDRRALDRVGGEVARATSVVRYAPGSKFSPHVHTGGEEFVVLEGVFQDEHGDFPAGSYIRNPPQSSHTPGSDKGCVILVKLWQFQPEDRTHVHLQTQAMAKEALAEYEGVSQTQLFEDEQEQVSLLHFEANTSMLMVPVGGAELFVLEGAIQDHQDKLVKHSWLRVPIDSGLNLIAGKNGATIWMKTGHLRDVENQIARVKQV